MWDFIKRVLGIPTEPLPIGHPLNPVGRSSKWDSTRKKHLKQFPVCCVSGLKTDLEVHHVRPYHLYPELELDPANLRTISRPYHFLFGHFCNWQMWNPDFDKMVAEIRAAMIAAERYLPRGSGITKKP